MAASHRPGFVAAWGPVLIDMAVVFGVLIPLWLWVIDRFDPGLITLVLGGFFGFFLPVQWVIIVSAMWAARSRWQDDGQKGD